MVARVLSLAALVLFLFWGCSPEKPEPLDTEDYFFLEPNKAIVYKVTEVRYAISVPDSVVTTWQEKDEIVRVSMSSDGFQLFTFARSKRNTPLEKWQKIKEYTVTHYQEKNVRSLDNVATITAAFPVSYRTTWDTNLHNDRGTEICSYGDIGSGYKAGELEFPKTVTVLGRNVTEDEVVSYNVALSRYAAGVGLIYDQQTDYLYSQEPADFGKRIIATGVSTIKEIIEY